ncbi:MAG: dinitrogenase iron-molybdenum cofactor biosynthesis protein [Pyramidobacter sp.]|uniref:NifB/NifX family molybdenum-iron cluster-binding protein n=1 Tax=Pyramidobacter sp. TaxID=1943581 RepID=UPI0025F3E7E5|nr:NifB/NifX family molybdenum-iron cluster-binding protein [Pyramidobacter sp.]MCI7404649.1 dinitrogenase iron-molybdenum cofactor biosynthesis protein [Pyramidobacter sp.]
MRIAVPCARGEIFQKFGLAETFKLYDTAGEKVTRSQIVDTEGYRRAALAAFLKQCQVDAVICGDIGEGARNALVERGIRFCAGCAGAADQAVRSLLNGLLTYDEHPPRSSREHGDKGAGN